MTEALVHFLRARLSDDEAFMQAAIRLRDSGAATASPEATTGAFALMDVIANDPDVVEALTVFTRTGTRAPGEAERVLAEVEAKRRILARYAEAVTSQRELAGVLERIRRRGQDALMAELEEASAIHKRDALARVLLDLAVVYADHPDYDEAWRP